jgi:hypothetical protein
MHSQLLLLNCTCCQHAASQRALPPASSSSVHQVHCVPPSVSASCCTALPQVGFPWPDDWQEAVQYDAALVVTLQHQEVHK